MNELPSPPRPAWSAYRVGVVVLCVLACAWRGWTTARWSWYADDWLYLADTRTMSFGHYLVQDYNGHLMPAGFLVSWVATKLAPLELWVPVVVVASGAALSVWLWGRALVAVAGERLLLLAPLALLAFSPLTIRPTIWWASALQALPMQISLALVVLAAARLSASGSRRDLGALVLALLVGLVFWEKALLLVIPAVAVLLHQSPGSFRERLRRHLFSLLAVAGLAVGYAVTYSVLTRTDDGGREMGVRLDATRRVSDHVEFFFRGLGDLLAPAMLGGPWHTMPIETDPLARPPWAVVVPAVLVVALVSAWAVRRFRGAWIPLVMALGYYAVSAGLVLYSGRFDMLGTPSISDERYLLDPFAVAVLAVVMLMASPTRRARTPRPAARGSRTSQWAARGVVLALAGSLVAGNVTAAARIGSRPSRSWVANVLDDVDVLQPVAVLDTYAPDAVLQAAFYPEEARLSRMLAPLHADLTFGGPTEQLYVVDGAGHLRKVQVPDATHAMPGPVEGCGYAIDAGEEEPAELSGELYSWEWVVQVNTIAGSGGELTVDLDGTTTTFEAGSGLRQHQFAYTGPVPRTVTLSRPDGTGTVCVTDIIIGDPIGE